MKNVLDLDTKKCFVRSLKHAMQRSLLFCIIYSLMTADINNGQQTVVWVKQAKKTKKS